MARLKFFGVRGSHPTPGKDNSEFGGNTSCTVLYSDADVAGEFPIIMDLGTGLTCFGESQPLDGSFHGVALLTHLHFDHIQGLPFFTPIDRQNARLVIYGPNENGVSLADSLNILVGPPFFPVTLSDLRGDIVVESIMAEEIKLDQPGSPKIYSRAVDHTNATFGFRIQVDDRVIAYVPDHQAPLDNATVSDSVLELCRDADLLIHDAQYTKEEFSGKPHWGHSTYDFALSVAIKSNAKALAFFHHDPRRSDLELGKIEESYRNSLSPAGLRIFAAREGKTLQI